MIKVKFQIRIRKSGEIINDEANVSSLATAREELVEQVAEFNRVERVRYGDDARLREFIAFDSSQGGQLQHDWRKKSLVGEERKYGIVDVYKCSQCGLKHEVLTLDGVPRGGDCFPERTCAECGRLYVDERNLKRHITRKHK